MILRVFPVLYIAVVVVYRFLQSLGIDAEEAGGFL